VNHGAINPPNPTRKAAVGFVAASQQASQKEPQWTPTLCKLPGSRRRRDTRCGHCVAQTNSSQLGDGHAEQMPRFDGPAPCIPIRTRCAQQMQAHKPLNLVGRTRTGSRCKPVEALRINLDLGGFASGSSLGSCGLRRVAPFAVPRTQWDADANPADWGKAIEENPTVRGHTEITVARAKTLDQPDPHELQRRSTTNSSPSPKLAAGAREQPETARPPTPRLADIKRTGTTGPRMDSLFAPTPDAS
jgi:hypothetical protein